MLGRIYFYRRFTAAISKNGAKIPNQEEVRDKERRTKEELRNIFA
jgi:hypothetical protein